MSKDIPIFDRPSLIKAWRPTNTQLAHVVRDLSPTVWAHREADRWSIAGQVEHLFLSANPVSSALKFPRGMLEARFGRYSGEPPQYDRLYTRYREALAGLNADFINPIPPSPEAKSQAELLESWALVGQKIPQRLMEWSESELDEYVLPHPLLGKLSVRGMLFFTLFHTDHHRRSIEQIIAQNA